jgi:vesicle-associated membrane protein 7
MCMGEEADKRRIPFLFLKDIKNRFRSTYGDRGKTAIAFAMNEDFSRVLAKQMDYFNNNPESDSISRVKGQIEEVKGVIIQDIEKVLARGERIELLVDKSAKLNESAFKFERRANRLKKAMWWKNVKMMLILFLIIAGGCDGAGVW